MFIKIYLPILAAACALLCADLRAEDDEAAMEMDTVEETDGLRLSAIVSAGTRYFAGFVDTGTGAASLVPEGGRIKRWRVEFIDEETMSATLSDEQGGNVILALKGDPGAAAAAAEAEDHFPRPKTLEEFLAEHPEYPRPPNMGNPTPTGEGPVTTFEDFVAKHPELAGKTNYVAPELLEGNTNEMPTLGEDDIDPTPISREAALRVMAESVGMPAPGPDEGMSQEDFLRMHAIPDSPAPMIGDPGAAPAP